MKKTKQLTAAATETAKPEKAQIVNVQASRCPRCGSTEKVGYYNTTEQAFSGIDPEGNPYTHIVRRRTRCGNPSCRQARVDRFLENRTSTE